MFYRVLILNFIFEVYNAYEVIISEKNQLPTIYKVFIDFFKTVCICVCAYICMHAYINVNINV